MSDLVLAGLDAFTAEDQHEIGQTLSCLLSGFGRRDAAALEDIYSDDADWVNAFGSVKKGRVEIIAYLQGLFADANFNAGRPVAPPISAARRLSDGVALISSRVQIEGQGLVGGGEIALRDNHSLRVLQKQPDGRWIIVSEMYMDARKDWSYSNHS